MGLALVVVEEHAGRTVHLGDDHPLGAVDDKGALVGHERDVAHVDVLLLDVLDRARAGFLVGLEHDQPQLHLQRRGVGHVALDAFLDVVLRVLELVGHVFEHRALVEILDREDGLEHRLDALVLAHARTDLALQELFVGGPLNLDQVRHLHRFGNAAEGFADALFASEGQARGDQAGGGLRHCSSQCAADRLRARCSCVHPRSDGQPWGRGSPDGRWKGPPFGGRSFALVGGRRTKPRSVRHLRRQKRIATPRINFAGDRRYKRSWRRCEGGYPLILAGLGRPIPSFQQADGYLGQAAQLRY